MSAFLLALSLWQCEARIPWPGVSFVGVGATEIEAKHSAFASCHAAGHAVCFVTKCEPMSGSRR